MTKARSEVDRGQLVPGRKRDDQIAMSTRQRARRHDQPAIQRAREGRDGALDSPASRTLTGLTSTPRRRHSLDNAELAGPGGYGGIPKDRRARHARRDLLEQLQPFPAHAVFEQEETGDIAARPRQAIDEAGADRIDDIREYDRHGAGHPQQRPQYPLPVARMTSGASATNSAACLRLRSASPPPQRVSIRTLRPSVQPNSCSACRNAPKRACPPDRPRLRRVHRCAACARPAAAHAPRAATPPRRRVA